MQTLDVQVGDLIAYNRRYDRTNRLTKVQRLTKTQAICADGERFMLDSGKLVGSTGWDIRFGRKVAPEDIAQIKLEFRIKKANELLKTLKATAANIDDIERMLAAVSKPAV